MLYYIRVRLGDSQKIHKKIAVRMISAYIRNHEQQGHIFRSRIQNL